MDKRKGMHRNCDHFATRKAFHNTCADFVPSIPFKEFCLIDVDILSRVTDAVATAEILNQSMYYVLQSRGGSKPSLPSAAAFELSEFSVPLGTTAEGTYDFVDEAKRKAREQSTVPILPNGPMMRKFKRLTCPMGGIVTYKKATRAAARTRGVTPAQSLAPSEAQSAALSLASTPAMPPTLLTPRYPATGAHSAAGTGSHTIREAVGSTLGGVVPSLTVAAQLALQQRYGRRGRGASVAGRGGRGSKSKAFKEYAVFQTVVSLAPVAALPLVEEPPKTDKGGDAVRDKVFLDELTGWLTVPLALLPDKAWIRFLITRGIVRTLRVTTWLLVRVCARPVALHTAPRQTTSTY